MKEYSKEELSELHGVLFEILEEIIRVCGVLGIEYSGIGGTAMGAYYFQDILPWDDDMDVGMTRENYDRFLKEAPAVLKPEYFLAWYGSDPETPFYFAKVRKRGTLFVEEKCRKLNMHHGIYVDIFPLDRVPRSKRAEWLQRRAVNRLNECFAGKSVWTWRYFGKCEIEKPDHKGFFGCLFTRAVMTLFPKKVIYRMLCWCLNLYNNREADEVSILMTSVDQIPIADMRNSRKTKFRNLEIVVPDHLHEYLMHHYGAGISKYPPKEKQVNHAPMKLAFNGA